MTAKGAVYFDPETVNTLSETLDDAWLRLPPERRTTVLRTTLADRILESAAQGERDRARLLDAALKDTLPPKVAGNRRRMNKDTLGIVITSAIVVATFAAGLAIYYAP